MDARGGPASEWGSLSMHRTEMALKAMLSVTRFLRRSLPADPSAGLPVNTPAGQETAGELPFHLLRKHSGEAAKRNDSETTP